MRIGNKYITLLPKYYTERDISHGSGINLPTTSHRAYEFHTGLFWVMELRHCQRVSLGA